MDQKSDGNRGGRDRSQGTEMPEKLTIPQFDVGLDFKPGKTLV